MTKKYNLILSKINKGLDRGWSGEYLVGYVKDMDGDAYLNYKLSSEAFNKQYAQFTQDDIDKLKASLPTKGMRAVVDASKVEVKEPLYYMQSKRTDEEGPRTYFTLLNDSKFAENTNIFYEDSFDDFLRDMDDKNKSRAFLTKSEWEPYLTPDRELVRYEPEEEK